MSWWRNVLWTAEFIVVFGIFGLFLLSTVITAILMVVGIIWYLFFGV